MKELGELIARIEGLTGPDREADCEIAWVTEWDTQGSHGGLWRDAYPSWRGDEWRTNRAANNWGVPAYTASLDAAVALCERVLPGWGISLGINIKTYGAHIWKPGALGPEFSGRHSRPAIALVLATLKALEASNAE